MKQEIADRWATALESGEFAQTPGVLCRTEDGDFEGEHVPAGFCCLGVLCEIAVADGVIQKREYGDGPDESDEAIMVYGSEDEFKNGGFSYALITKSVSEWAGVPGPNVYFDVSHLKDQIGNAEIFQREDGRLIISATELNDVYGFTFNDIAKLVRDGKIVDPSS